MDSEQSEARQRFIEGISAGLGHFQTLAAQGDAGMADLDEQRENLHQIVQFGLTFPETWPVAASVIDQTFPLVERRGYWTEWLPVVRLGLDQNSNNNSYCKTKLLNRLGLLYRLSRQLPDAIKVHQDAEGFAIKLGDEKLLAQTRYYLLGDYLDNRQYSKAEAIGLKALSLFEKHDVEVRWIGSTLRLLGQTARELGYLDLAKIRSEKATAIWRSLDEPTELARSLNDLASIYLIAEEFEQAIQCYEEALEILEASVNELDKALIFTNLGALYFRQGCLIEAELAFRQANSPYLRRSPQYFYHALVANGLGNVLLEQGRFDEAIIYLEEARRLWHVTDDKVNLANTLGALGEVHAMKGQTSIALSLYNETISLLESYPEGDWAKRIFKRVYAKRKELLDNS